MWIVPVDTMPDVRHWSVLFHSYLNFDTLNAKSDSCELRSSMAALTFLRQMILATEESAWSIVPVASENHSQVQSIKQFGFVFILALDTHTHLKEQKDIKSSSA